MNKYLFLLPIILFSCQQKQIVEDVPQKPNIILILTDDQGWGDLSIHGNGNLSTPNIDKLAQNGASFDRFYVSPVCSPTRAELLTGRYHVRGGVYSTSAGGERLDLDETTFAEVFQDAGYKTAAFGKWHNGMQYPYHPNARGFEEYYGFCSGHWGNYFSPFLEHNGEIVNGNGFVIDDFTERAMEFIESNKEEPFLVYLPYNTPHSPMQVPEQYWTKFENMDLEYRHRNPENENVQHTKAALAMVENIDWNVGRLSDKIASLGLEENTIFIYMTDNGPNGNRWNEGMKGRKGSTDEGGVRSPLFVQWKGTIMEGHKIPQIASAIDLFPTLADLAGISYETEKKQDGLSLIPLLLQDDSEWSDRFVINHWRGRTAVRSQQYRLDHEDNLFDMIADPGQATDISNTHPEVFAKLKEAKTQWESEVLIELPEEDDRTFPVGHPDYPITQIPARDGIATGTIQRSNRYPNDSFFLNWTSTNDSIYWDIEALTEGEYSVELYYTCKKENIGTNIQLSLEGNTLEKVISEAHDPPLTGMENDRDPRIESYVKDFKSLNMGSIHLDKGKGRLTLRALEIPGNEAIDFRLMMVKRID
jgi:arylsulfatase A-like enzyme